MMRDQQWTIVAVTDDAVYVRHFVGLGLDAQTLAMDLADGEDSWHLVEGHLPIRAAADRKVAELPAREAEVTQ